jgi:hypothetical protein
VTDDSDALHAMADGLENRIVQGAVVHRDRRAFMLAARMLRAMAGLREAGVPMDVVSRLSEVPAASEDRSVRRARSIVATELALGPPD